MEHHHGRKGWKLQFRTAGSIQRFFIDSVLVRQHVMRRKRAEGEDQGTHEISRARFDEAVAARSLRTAPIPARNSAQEIGQGQGRGRQWSLHTHSGCSGEVKKLSGCYGHLSVFSLCRKAHGFDLLFL